MIFSTGRLEELTRIAQETLSQSVITDEGLDHARFKIEEMGACLHLAVEQAVEAARGNPKATIAVLNTALELSATFQARMKLIQETAAIGTSASGQIRLAGFGEA